MYKESVFRTEIGDKMLLFTFITFDAMILQNSGSFSDHNTYLMVFAMSDLRKYTFTKYFAQS